MASIGDVNNDGVKDFAIVAKTRVIIIFGRNAGFTSAVSSDIVISGVGCEWVMGVGDINGDGVDDFALGEKKYDEERGRVIIIFGRTSGFPTEINLGEDIGSQGGFVF